MTVAEFRDRLADGPVILLPLGSQEEQGPHTPMGDYLLAEAVALRTAELSGAIAAPCLPFGYADFFRGFPGGMQLRGPTFRAVLTDMVDSFLDHGLTRIVILNGHSTNAALIDEVLRDTRRHRGAAVCSIDLWRAIPDALWRDHHGENSGRARGHGGDPITSMALYLRADQMRMDLAVAANGAQAMGLPATGTRGVRFDGVDIALPLDAHELAPNGMLGGDPALASAEFGCAVFDHLSNHCARFVEHLRRSDPCDLKAGPAA
ncbi:creatininase family protein [Paracoccus sp. TK19116]|uniref:Creatininase family protein n=1 Tax=Paracoccus albicereus TaxID=2922394 RepID=A0ABT1MSI7_9RHOB|nr:creatininase family protein [Paracoccus albicereus]MCQ0971141.1 creatininase family protein [Paracoccus albicereus]